VNRTIALVVSDTNVPLGTPSIIVGITGTTGKHTRGSPRGKVVRQVERRHAKEWVSMGFKGFQRVSMGFKGFQRVSKIFIVYFAMVL